MIHVLEKNPLFKQLSSADVEHLIACLKPEVRTYQAGETIFMSHERLQAFGIVIAGTIELLKDNFYGHETLIQTMGPAASFGEAVALKPDSLTRVRAVSKTMSSIAFFNMARFLSQCATPCRQHQTLQRNLLEMLAGKLVDLHQKIDLITQPTIRDKLLDFLHQEQIKHQSNTFTLALSRQRLADTLNVNRSALGRILKTLQEEGVLRVERNTFTIVSRNR